MPRSSKNPRISFIKPVRPCTSRSRTRCMACTSSCSSLLIGTKRHVLLAHGFSDRRSIDKVIFIRFTVGLYKLGGNQAHVVPLRLQSGSQEVRSRTCFQANQ